MGDAVALVKVEGVVAIGWVKGILVGWRASKTACFSGGGCGGGTDEEEEGGGVEDSMLALVESSDMLRFLATLPNKC